MKIYRRVCLNCDWKDNIKDFNPKAPGDLYCPACFSKSMFITGIENKKWVEVWIPPDTKYIKLNPEYHTTGKHTLEE